MTFLLDTNICVAMLRNRQPRPLARLREVGPAAVRLSVITVLELRQGAEKSQDPRAAHHKLDFFLGPMVILPFEVNDALTAARVRAGLEAQGKKIGDLDSLIAAQALARGLILVTDNRREFDRVEGLRVENWL